MEEKKISAELPDEALDEVAGGAYTAKYNEETGFWEVRLDNSSGCQIFRSEAEALDFIKKKVCTMPDFKNDSAKRLRFTR